MKKMIAVSQNTALSLVAILENKLRRKKVNRKK